MFAPAQSTHRRSQRNSPTGKELGDLGPLVAKIDVAVQNGPVLLDAPGLLADVGVEMVVPPLPALLPDPSREVGSDQRPLLGPVLLHQLHDLGILVLGPGSLDQGGLEDLLPAVQALHLGTAWDLERDELPVLGPVLVHCPSEGLVLGIGEREERKQK